MLMNNENKSSAVSVLLDKINDMQYIISVLENRVSALEREIINLKGNISTVWYTWSYTDLQNVPVVTSCRQERTPATSDVVPNYITNTTLQNWDLTITYSDGTEMHFDANEV